MASRYEEDILGSTTIGFPGVSFYEGPGDTSQLGSGYVYLDDVAGSREVASNASRIESWRRTPMYRMYQEVNVLSLNCFNGYFSLRAPYVRISSAAVRPTRSKDLIFTISYGDCGA
jgi:hypothetical protein